VTQDIQHFLSYQARGVGECDFSLLFLIVYCLRRHNLSVGISGICEIYHYFPSPEYPGAFQETVRFRTFLELFLNYLNLQCIVIIPNPPPSSLQLSALLTGCGAFQGAMDRPPFFV
jgi:hypothetical protein